MAYFLGNDMAKKEKNYTDWRELEDQADKVIASILSRTKIASSSVELKNYIYYKLPRWRDLAQWLKLSILFRCVLNTQEYSAFTLRFSRAKIEKALKTSKNTLSDYLRRRISQSMKNKLGFVPEYLFGIHIDNALSFHIHGIIKVGHNEKAIREALKLAAFGVNYQKQKIHRSILCFRELFSSDGWLKYIFKYKNYDEAIYQSRTLSQKTQQFYENIRNKL